MPSDAEPFCLVSSDLPLAAPGLVSYRYWSRYGWIMIGATDDRDALNEAQRSLCSERATEDRLEKWTGTRYEPTQPQKETTHAT